MLQLAGLVRDAFFYKSYIPGTHERAEHYNKLHHDDKRQLYATMRYALAFWLSLQKELPKLARKKHLEIAHCCSFIALEKVLSGNSPIYHVGAELKTAMSQLKLQWALPLYLAWIKKYPSFESLLESIRNELPLSMILSQHKNINPVMLFGHPPLGVRIHDLAATQELDLLGVVKKIGDRTMILKKNTDEAKALFAQGKISYQNPSAQKISVLLDAVLPLLASVPLAVLDACAAPGAKSHILLEKLRASDSLTCSDLPDRCDQLQDNLARTERFQASQTRIISHNWEERGLDQQFDLIVLDGPCSGSGVTRKHPDALWRLSQDQIDASQQRLIRIGHNVLNSLKPGGFLIYATCSLLREENDAVIEQFIHSNQAQRHPISLDIGVPTCYGVQILPDQSHDGLFYAVMQKKS